MYGGQIILSSLFNYCLLIMVSFLAVKDGYIINFI